MYMIVLERGSLGLPSRLSGVALAVPSYKARGYSTPSQNTRYNQRHQASSPNNPSSPSHPLNPSVSHDAGAYNFRGSGFSKEFEKDRLNFGEAPKEGKEVEENIEELLGDEGLLYKMFLAMPKVSSKERKLGKKDIKPPGITTLPRRRLPYSDVRNFPKEVFPFEEDPSPPEQYMHDSQVPTNWIHAKNNDGQGTVVYQLQYNNWKINNALDLKSLQELHNHLKKLDNGSFPYAIVVRGSDRTGVFSPGADLRQLTDEQYATEFYKTTAETSFTIATMQTPTFLAIQGRTAGLGAGLCLHSMFRLATDECSWSMPNVLYGSIPDAGATWMLPRLKGNIGMYLALTGKRLESYDIVRAGIATHFISLDDLDWWEQATSLVKDQFIFTDMLKHFLMQTSIPRIKSALKPNEAAIQRCFSATTLEGVFKALEAENTPWSARILKRLHKCSPLMLHVTFRLQRMGLIFQSLEEALQMEYRVALNSLSHPDFKTGIKRALTGKICKRWAHKDIHSVLPEEVARFFQPHPQELLHFVPAQPGLRPQDPYRVYEPQMKVLMDDPGYLISKELDKLLPPQDQTGQSLKDLYIVLMEAGGLNKEAAEFFRKVEVLQELSIHDTDGLENETGLKRRSALIDRDNPEIEKVVPEYLFGTYSYKMK